MNFWDTFWFRLANIIRSLSTSCRRAEQNTIMYNDLIPSTLFECRKERYIFASITAYSTFASFQSSLYFDFMHCRFEWRLYAKHFSEKRESAFEWIILRYSFSFAYYQHTDKPTHLFNFHIILFSKSTNVKSSYKTQNPFGQSNISK